MGNRASHLGVLDGKQPGEDWHCELGNEIDVAAYTEGGPEEVPLEGATHVEDGEGDEDHEADDLLDDLQLREREFAAADAVGGDLRKAFKEGDAPYTSISCVRFGLRQAI
jgi:hypothetical protein